MKVVAECTLKESAAINQILGRKVKREIFQIENRNISNRNIEMFQTRGGNDNLMEISTITKFLQWHALTREEQAKYYEQVINLAFVFVI